MNLSKNEAFYFIEMLESSLINYRVINPWADQIILKIKEPPVWIFDLSLKKYQGDLLKALREFAYSEPFEKEPDDIDKFHVACLWLRYERRELSWATLLNKIGYYLDAHNGNWDCETPYHYLNIYEVSNFTETSEEETKKEYLSEQNVIPYLKKAKDKLRELS